MSYNVSLLPVAIFSSFLVCISFSFLLPHYRLVDQMQNQRLHQTKCSRVGSCGTSDESPLQLLVQMWLCGWEQGESFWSSLFFNHMSNITNCQLPLRVLLSTSHATIWDKHFKWEVIWHQFGWFTWQTTDYSRFQCVGFPIEDQIFILISLNMPHQAGAYALKWRWWFWWPSVLVL